MQAGAKGARVRSGQRESEQHESEQREQGAVGAGARSGEHNFMRSGEHEERDARAQ